MLFRSVDITIEFAPDLRSHRFRKTRDRPVEIGDRTNLRVRVLYGGIEFLPSDHDDESEYDGINNADYGKEKAGHVVVRAHPFVRESLAHAKVDRGCNERYGQDDGEFRDPS